LDLSAKILQTRGDGPILGDFVRTSFMNGP